MSSRCFQESLLFCEFRRVSIPQVYVIQHGVFFIARLSTA